jgi:hypothetical protein
VCLYSHVKKLFTELQFLFLLRISYRGGGGAGAAANQVRSAGIEAGVRKSALSAQPGAPTEVIRATIALFVRVKGGRN